MKQRLLITLLCAAIFSCEKEKPVSLSTNASPGWRPSGVTQQTSTYRAAPFNYLDPPIPTIWK
ncbi:MAG TPA: hypothetical protein VIH86_02900 [Puia sp.]